MQQIKIFSSGSVIATETQANQWLAQNSGSINIISIQISVGGSADKFRHCVMITYQELGAQNAY